MNNLRFKIKIYILCIPGLAGFVLFFLWLFGRSLWYSFVNDVYHKDFVWFDNYLAVFNNQYFRLALKNTIIFSLVGVGLLLLLSITLSLGLSKLAEKFSFIKSAYILPMLLPSVSVIFIWRMVFDNDMYFTLMKEGNPLVQALPIYALYLWKNTGINVILLTAAFSKIPREILEAAELEGARGLRLYRYMTIPLIVPELFFVAILSFVNSLKVFRESYLFFGTDYPPDAVYTLQYYMNNHFMKLNYQNLSSASAILAVILAIIIFISYRLQNHYMKDVSL